MSNYLKAIHIIFVITWFAGLFYMPRLFIYNTEAGEKDNEEVKTALRTQFAKMMKGLWYGITWPSGILTLIFGVWLMINNGWLQLIFDPDGLWLLLKLIFVIGLYFYHYSLHLIFKQELKGVFRYSSMQLRIWNEVATIFCVAIVMLVVVKQGISLVWGFVGLILFIIILMSAIKVYKIIREKKSR